MPSWFKDFEIRDKKIVVKATGVELPLGFDIIKEALDWVPFYFYEKFRRLKCVFSSKPCLSIAYSPVVPRPWYLLSVLAYRACLKQTKDFAKADAVFYFEDQTLVKPPQIPAGITGKTFNFGCYDISKSNVASTFEQVFGYNLAVDPHKYKGPIAVKSEKNGAHDGYQTVAPLPVGEAADPNMVYPTIRWTVNGQKICAALLSAARLNWFSSNAARLKNALPTLILAWFCASQMICSRTSNAPNLKNLPKLCIWIGAGWMYCAINKMAKFMWLMSTKPIWGHLLPYPLPINPSPSRF